MLKPKSTILDNLSKEYIERMRELIGDSELEHFLESYFLMPTCGIIINKNKINEDNLQYLNEILYLKKQDDFTYEVQNKSYLEKTEKIGRNVFHHIGSFYVSEPSAMRVVPSLDIQKNDKILDLCSAPGGKAIQALMYLDESLGGILYANEIVPSRCKILSSNLERIGAGNVVILNSDAKKIADGFNNYFDKVIVDAPCSGEGMFRKYPYAITEWSLKNVQMCANRQKEIIAYALEMVKEGGKLAYSTCTFEKEEDEDIKEFVLKNNRFELVFEEKLFPHTSSGEGQYIAVFQKKYENEYVNTYKNVAITSNKERLLSKKNNYNKTKENSLKKINEKLYYNFEKEYFNHSIVDTYKELVCINDNIYLINNRFNSCKNVKVFKKGVLLGNVVKNVFIPSHALSHYIEPSNFKNKLDLTNFSSEIEKYLHGDVLNINMTDGQNNSEIYNGYILICYNNLGVGFGKATINNGKIVVKNHYPKGIRNL